jgi:hypothetical protein
MEAQSLPSRDSSTGTETFISSVIGVVVALRPPLLARWVFCR